MTAVSKSQQGLKLNKRKVRWTGKKFGQWTVMSVPFIPRGKKRKHDENSSSARAHVLCRCKCSRIVMVACDSLKRKHSRQCTDCAIPKHGYWNSPTYTSWRCIVQRCTNENATGFANYFGLIDPRWLGIRGFQTFLSEVGERPKGTTAGRFLDLGAYSKRTFSWMAHEQQLWHRREAGILMRAIEADPPQITFAELDNLVAMYRRMWHEQKMQVKEQQKGTQ
jgi:hypothetical protein